MPAPPPVSPSRFIATICWATPPAEPWRCSTTTPPTAAIALRFNRQELPCFTVWKNTAALEDGYVTGLEPATNFPNFKTFERQQGRVVRSPSRRPLGDDLVDRGPR